MQEDTLTHVHKRARTHHS